MAHAARSMRSKNAVADWSSTLGGGLAGKEIAQVPMVMSTSPQVQQMEPMPLALVASSCETRVLADGAPHEEEATTTAATAAAAAAEAAVATTAATATSRETPTQEQEEQAQAQEQEKEREAQVMREARRARQYQWAQHQRENAPLPSLGPAQVILKKVVAQVAAEMEAEAVAATAAQANKLRNLATGGAATTTAATHVRQQPR
jgi:hypothetical protein